MPLPPQRTLAQFNTDFINAYVAGLNPAFGVTASAIPSGDPIRAIGGAVSPQAVYLQGLIYNMIALSRASTSIGADLDTWLADFGFARAQGNQATAVVTFPTSNGLAAASTIPIPANTTILQTQPITVGATTTPTVYSFTVAEEQPAGVLSQITQGQSSVTLLCTAQQVGGVYNFIPSNTPLSIQQPIPGVGSPVINSISGGVDEASDPQARLDFVNYIQSLQSATKGAIITALQDASASFIYGQTYTIVDAALNGNSTPVGPIPLCPAGVIYVILANQSNLNGGYDATSANAVKALAAVQKAEAFGITVICYDTKYYFAQSIQIPISVSGSGLVAANISIATLLATAQAQVDAYINNLGMGQAIEWSSLISILRSITFVSTTGQTIANIITDVGFQQGSGAGIEVWWASGSGGHMIYAPYTNQNVPPGTSAGVDQFGLLRTSFAVSSPPVTTNYVFGITNVA